MISSFGPTIFGYALLGRRVQKCRIESGFDTATIAHSLGLTIASYEAREAGRIRFELEELMELGFKFKVRPSTFAP